MMKVKISLLLIFTFLLAGCSEQTVEPELISGGTETTVAKETEDAGFYFVYNGITLTPGDDWVSVKESLGEEQSYHEEESCEFDGFDRTYDYSDIVIYTKDPEDTEVLSVIDVASEDLSSPEGIKIGMNADDIREILGEPDDEYFGAYVYNKGSTQLLLYLDNNVLTTFSYQYNG